MIKYNLKGMRFGRLRVTELSKEKRRGGTLWVCECDCGTIKTLVGGNLYQGLTKSCGCLNSERSIEQCKENITHGMTKSPEYKIWQGIRQRCENTKCRDYKNYGMRGIKVCDQWANFESFYRDMGPRPSRHHSIERKNNSADYDPTNCHWACSVEQGLNKRTNLIVAAFGRAAPLVTFIPTGGHSKPYWLALERIHKGWNAEDAIKYALRAD